MGYVVDRLARWLTDRENLRTQTDYDSHELAKVMGFRFLCSYFVLYYVAFFKDNTDLFGVPMQCMHDNCFVDLQSQLAMSSSSLVTPQPGKRAIFLPDAAMPANRKSVHVGFHSQDEKEMPITPSDVTTGRSSIVFPSRRESFHPSRLGKRDSTTASVDRMLRKMDSFFANVRSADKWAL